MRKIAFIHILLVAILTSSCIHSGEFSYCELSQTEANVYKKESLDSRLMTTLHQGDIMYIKRQTSGWTKIYYYDQYESGKVNYHKGYVLDGKFKVLHSNRVHFTEYTWADDITASAVKKLELQIKDSSQDIVLKPLKNGNNQATYLYLYEVKKLRETKRSSGSVAIYNNMFMEEMIGSLYSGSRFVSPNCPEPLSGIVNFRFGDANRNGFVSCENLTYKRYEVQELEAKLKNDLANPALRDRYSIQSLPSKGLEQFLDDCIQAKWTVYYYKISNMSATIYDFSELKGIWEVDEFKNDDDRGPFSYLMVSDKVAHKGIHMLRMRDDWCLGVEAKSLELVKEVDLGDNSVVPKITTSISINGKVIPQWPSEMNPFFFCIAIGVLSILALCAVKFIRRGGWWISALLVMGATLCLAVAFMSNEFYDGSILWVNKYGWPWAILNLILAFGTLLSLCFLEQTIMRAAPLGGDFGFVFFYIGFFVSLTVLLVVAALLAELLHLVNWVVVIAVGYTLCVMLGALIFYCIKKRPLTGLFLTLFYLFCCLSMALFALVLLRVILLFILLIIIVVFVLPFMDKLTKDMASVATHKATDANGVSHSITEYADGSYQDDEGHEYTKSGNSFTQIS